MKNYTSLEKMKASEVAPSFTEEKVTAEKFAEEVAKGTLYKGFEPPKDTTMLKFRYYSPDGTLIEQNNVPVVYDGTGIESVVTYYLLTDKKDGITLDSDGWTDKVQTVTAEKRFLWSYTETIYTNKAYSRTDPCITAVFGEQGERGAMYLGHYANNQDAYTKNNPALFTGDYYLNTTDSYIYVYNKENNIWKQITDLTDYRYNQSINDIFEAIESSTDREKFLKAKIAWVQNLSAAIARVQMLLANEIKLTSGTDLNGKTTGGIIKSANYQKGKSGWQIDYQGNAEFQNGEFRGTFNGLHIGASENIAYIDFKEQSTSGTVSDQGSFSIGNNVTARGGSSVVGSNSSSSGRSSIVVGRQNTNSGDNSFLIGKSLSNSKGMVISIGNDNIMIESQSISIGNTIENEGESSIVIGNQAKAKKYQNSNSETVSALGAIAIGNKATTRGFGSIAIGNNTETYAENSVAIGKGVSANQYKIINIGSGINSFQVYKFPSGTTHATVYSQLMNNAIKKMTVGTSSLGGCIGNYRYEICKYGISKVTSGVQSISFWNASNDSVLTVTNDSTKTLEYNLIIGLLPIQ